MELREVQDGPGEEGRMKLNWMKSSLEWKGTRRVWRAGGPTGADSSAGLGMCWRLRRFQDTGWHILHLKGEKRCREKWLGFTQKAPTSKRRQCDKIKYFVPYKTKVTLALPCMWPWGSHHSLSEPVSSSEIWGNGTSIYLLESWGNERRTEHAYQSLSTLPGRGVIHSGLKGGLCQPMAPWYGLNEAVFVEKLASVEIQVNAEKTSPQPSTWRLRNRKGKRAILTPPVLGPRSSDQSERFWAHPARGFTAIFPP